MSTVAASPPLREESANKTPRRLKQARTPNSPCVVPILEGKSSNKQESALEKYGHQQEVEALERDQTFMTSSNDFIPLDILNSLTQVPTPPTREQLGPPTKHKKLKAIEGGSVQARRRPANVWNYPKGREKLKHLTEQPPCLCGAGKDISFLYDAVNHKCKDKKDSPDEKTAKSQNRLPVSIRKEIQELGPGAEKVITEDDNKQKQQAAGQIPDTLVPSEYHIVKKPGVMGLEFHDDIYTTYVHNHEDHLTIFPSMKPSGRGEVLKLKHTMDSLLSRAGVDDSDKELTGPTQIHNLLELVKKEQNIYNVCFNEIIRQVTVECAERGELLANIRKRYSFLIDRIPRQVKSLHQEVIAQRALDRRLTEELVRFKGSISTLTSELASVRAHDRAVTKQASVAQEELEEALLESEKNASLLTEYHDLYELQRKRLETQVGKLTEERDLWGSAAYTLAMKVTDKHSLNTAKTLHLCEKAWARLTRHFAIFLSEKDSIQLESLTEHVQLWREKAEQFNKQLEVSEEQTKNKLQKLVDQWTQWKQEFEKIIDYDDGSVTIPTRQFIIKLSEDLKNWEEVFNEEAERFTGEVLLAREDELETMNKQVDHWTDISMKVFGRHQTPEGERWPSHGEMLVLNQEVDQLHQQFHVRTIGENGVAKGIIDLVNPIETWCNKLEAILQGGEMITDTEWIRLADYIGNDWIEHLSGTINLIGSTQKEGARLAGQAEKKIQVKQVVIQIAKWLSTAANGIDNEDGKIVQTVSLIHSAMIRWMITVLLRLAPDMEDKELEELSSADTNSNVDSSIGGGEILLQSTSEEILNRANQLFRDLTVFSTQLTKCCTDLVATTMQERRDQGDEHADMEYKDLKRLAIEFKGWIHTAKIMIQEVTGEVFVPEDEPLKPDNKKQEKTEGKSSLPDAGEELVVEERPYGRTSVAQSDDGRTTKLSDNAPVPSPRETPRGTPKLTTATSEPISATPEPITATAKPVTVTPKPTTAAPKQITATSEPITTTPKPTTATPDLINATPKPSTATPEPITATPEPAQPEEGDAARASSGGTEQAEQGGAQKQEKIDGNKMHVLCHDDNIRTKSLENLPVDQEIGFLDVPESVALPARSPSPDTRKALEALAAVERLQSQLLETEERAQGAEERAIQTETELKQALERIRALERSASRASAISTLSAPGQQTPAGTPLSGSASKRTVTHSPTGHSRSPSQQSTRASTRTPSRKK